MVGCWYRLAKSTSGSIDGDLKTERDQVLHEEVVKAEREAVAKAMADLSAKQAQKAQKNAGANSNTNKSPPSPVGPNNKKWSGSQ